MSSEGPAQLGQRTEGRVGKSKGIVRARPTLCSEVLTCLHGRRLSLSPEPGSTTLPLPSHLPLKVCLPHSGCGSSLAVLNRCKWKVAMKHIKLNRAGSPSPAVIYSGPAAKPFPLVTSLSDCQDLKGAASTAEQVP